MSIINEQTGKINGLFFTTDGIGKIFSWSEVSEIHKTRHGIYQRGGQLISLLTDFGKINPCYPDFHGETTDTIFYTGAGRRGDQKLDAWNKSLFDAIETKISVPLFNKLKIGSWQFLGFWRVSEGKYIFDEKQKRMVWKFTLESVQKSNAVIPTALLFLSSVIEHKPTESDYRR